MARKGTQAGKSMVSFLLACFLYSFHNYLLKADHVSGLGDGSDWNQMTTPVLWEFIVKWVSYPSFRKMLVQAYFGIFETRWGHPGLSYNPTRRAAIHGLGGWGLWRCAKGSDLFYPGGGRGWPALCAPATPSSTQPILALSFVRALPLPGTQLPLQPSTCLPSPSASFWCQLTCYFLWELPLSPQVCDGVPAACSQASLIMVLTHVPTWLSAVLLDSSH